MAVRASTQNAAVSTTPALVPQAQHAGKPSMPLGRPFTLIGSRHRAHLHLLSRTVSKCHATLINDQGTLYIRDTASREHVFINGERVKEAELRDGDLVKIGSFTFKLTGGGKGGRPGRGAPEAALEVQDSPLPSLFEGRTLLIGRRPTCDVVLTEMAVSNVHAIIFELGGKHYIRDLGSRTGVFVNGEQVHQQAVKFNDQIRIGEHEMRFVAAEPASSLDELEHLIGTATLGDEQYELASADAKRAGGEAPPLEAADELDALPLAPDDDLIPLEVEHQPAAAAVPSEPGAKEGADLAELDLLADPDAVGPGDTRPIPIDLDSPTPETPGISGQVVNADDELGIDNEERHLLVGGDLHEDRLSASGSFANVEHDDDEPAVDEMAELHDLGVIPPDFEEAHASADSAAAQAAHEPAASEPATDETPVVPLPDALTAPVQDEHHGEEEIPAASSDKDDDDDAVRRELLSHVSPDMSPEDLEAIAWMANPTPATDETAPPAFPGGLNPSVSDGAVGIPHAASHEGSNGKATRDDSSHVSRHEPSGEQKSTEILGITEPTPESAQDLETQIDPGWEQADADLLPSPDELGDTQLGVAIREFAGSALGSLVEQPALTAEHSITAHESIAAPTEPEVVVPEPRAFTAAESVVEPQSELDSVETFADRATAAQPAEEPVVNFEDILAHEGLLEPSGDELVDQAIAFLNHEHDAPATDDASSPPVRAPDDASPVAANAPVAEPEPAPHSDLLPEPDAAAAESGSGDDAGLEFDDPTLEEAFAAVDAQAPVVVETSVTASEDITGIEEQAVEFVAPSENAPAAVEEDLEFTLGADFELPPESGNEPHAADLEPAEHSDAFDAVWMDDTAPHADPNQGSIEEVENEVAPAGPQAQGGATPTAPPPSVTDPAAPKTPPARIDPLAGMSRDFGSFLGGVPLGLQPPPSMAPPAMPTRPAIRQQPPGPSAPQRNNRPRQPTIFSEAPVSVNLGTTPMPPMIRPSTPAPAAAPVAKAPPVEAPPVEPESDLDAERQEIDEIEPGLEFEPVVDEIEEIAPPHEVGPATEEAEAVGTGLDFESESESESGEIEAVEALPAAEEASAEELPAEDISDSITGSDEALLDQAFEHLSPAEGEHAAQTSEEPLPELFDSNPELLDAMPESLEPISDLAEAVGESAPESSHHEIESPAEEPAPESVQPAPAPTRPTPVGESPEAPLPAGKSGSRKQPPGAPNKTIEPAADAGGKVKRPGVVPPPPARSSGRVPRPAAGQRPTLDAYENAVIPSADAFSQTPVGLAANDEPEIPQTGFIPPGSIQRRGRSPAGARPPAARRDGTGPGKPTVARKKAAPDVQEEEMPFPVESLPMESLPSEAELQEQAAPLPYAPGQKKPKKRWRFPFFGLLVLLVLACGGAAGTWFGLASMMQPTVKAAFRFDHVEQLADRGKYMMFENSQRQILNSEDFLKLAQGVFENDLHGHGGDGFLYPQNGSEGDFPAIAKDARFEGEARDGVIRIDFERAKSRDPAGDRTRFHAVLKALYARDQALFDEAARNRADLERARANLVNNAKSIADLQAAIEDGQKQQAAFELAAQKEKDIADRSAAVEKNWSQAASSTRQLKTVLEAMEAAALASTDSPPPSADNDAQIKEMSDRLKQLGDSLASARSTNGGARSNAADTPINGLQKAIEVARPGAEDGPLGEYLATAQKVHDAIGKMDGDLIDRKRETERAMGDLNRAIAEKVEAHLKAAYAADADLKNFQQDLSVQQHRLGAATSAGLTDEAARISTQVNEAQKKVDARRAQFASPADYPEDIKSIQKLAADEAEQMRGEETRNEQRVAEQFKLLDGAAPKLDALTTAQRSAYDRIVDKVMAVNLAHRKLGDATDSDVKALELRVADLQSQIDARKRQIADAAKAAALAPDPATLAQHRFTLETARQAEARALADWTVSKNELIAAQTALDAMQSRIPDLARDTRQLAAAQAETETLRNRVASDQAFPAVTPRNPDSEESTSVIAGRFPDVRKQALAVIAGITALIATLLIVRSIRAAGAGPRGGPRRGSLDEEPPPFPRSRATAA